MVFDFHPRLQHVYFLALCSALEAPLLVATCRPLPLLPPQGSAGIEPCVKYTEELSHTEDKGEGSTMLGKSLPTASPTDLRS